ncbi:MAG: hypothetical protein GVY26_14435 [Bacteroidetes bacterium]|jgi:hypothetical protein|nr:hypothetical protein [Bacteroidota bacterium]
MEEQQSAPKLKPDWLQRLEQESYQAELIISGVAIFGTLQLPSLIKKLVIFSLDSFSQNFMEVGYLLFVYLIIASELLIVSFVLHFLLRTLWIGNIGLASVYPEGIKLETDKFSEDFGRKLKKVFPSFEQFNKSLDDLCSVMFALAALFAMVFLSIALFLALLVLLCYLIALPFEGLSFQTLLYWLGGALFVLFMLQGLMGLPALREKDWIKRVHFPINMVVSKALYGPFYRPVTYITYIFMTNSKGYKSVGLAFVFLFTVSFFSFPLINETRILFTQSNYQEKVRLSDTRMRFYNYDDQRPTGDYIPFASIPSEVVRGTVLPVFVTLRNDPEEFVDNRCEDEAPSTSAEKSRVWISCLQEYYRFYINEAEIEPTGFYTYKWPESRQYGIRAFLPMQGVPPGGHRLRIAFDGPEVDSTLRHDILVPFQYYPEEELLK